VFPSLVTLLVFGEGSTGIASETSVGLPRRYADGHVLIWNETLWARHPTRTDQLPDNLGVAWASGLYGNEMPVHVLGAWKVFQHSGNVTVLDRMYRFYRVLFNDTISGNVWGHGFDAFIALKAMATELQSKGLMTADAVAADHAHFDSLLDTSDTYVQTWLNTRWEIQIPDAFASGVDYNWGKWANSGMSQFPREWAVRSANTHVAPANESAGMNYGSIGLSCIRFTDWARPFDPQVIGADFNFAYTPDSNYYILKALYEKQIHPIANKYTLEHFRGYNMEPYNSGIPFAPEARRMDFSQHGDQFSKAWVASRTAPRTTSSRTATPCPTSSPSWSGVCRCVETRPPRRCGSRHALSAPWGPTVRS
jgi:hypothetical protein